MTPLTYTVNDRQPDRRRTTMENEPTTNPDPAIPTASIPPPTTGLTFGSALVYLKEGRRVQRAGWNGPGQWLGLQVPDQHSKMKLPYIYISPVSGQLVPWLASQTDMLAEDWSVVE